MTETRERYCPHCGRANPITMPRCMNCGQRVGGNVLLTEEEQTVATRTSSTPWWHTSDNSAIPPPPQVREQIARQEAASREKERLIEEQRRFQERLEEERQRSAERLATIRERRQTRNDPAQKTTVNPGAASGTTANTTTTVTNCHRCGSTLGQAGHTFSFCLNCGADVSVKAKTTASAQAKNTVTTNPEQRNQAYTSARQTSTNGVSFKVTTQTTGRQRSEMNPTVPAILSFLFPGVGQFINGQPTKGVVLLLALFVATVVFNVSGLFLLLGRGLAALDAYSIAKRRREGWPVREDEWDFGG